MKYLTIAFAILLASCQKNEQPQPTPPAPPPVVNICCPTTSPIQYQPANGATIAVPITWQWSKVEGAAKYHIEALAEWTGSAGQQYSAVVLNTVVTDTFRIQTALPAIPVGWNGAEGRWRVRGMSTDNDLGPWSSYRTFVVSN